MPRRSWDRISDRLSSLLGRSNRSGRTFRTRRIARSPESLEPRLVLDSTVVVNEIMYHPADDAAPEWIELFNQMAVDMDLSGWSLGDGVEFDFPQGTVISGGEYLVVASDPGAMGFGTLGPFTSGRLSNGGERVALLDNNDRVMNEVDYRDSGKWPVAPDGSGTTLAKRDEGTSSEPAENWTSSEQVGGTPGAVNFPPFEPVVVTATLLEVDGAWRYDDSGADRGTSWRDAGFDDSAWPTGDGLFFDEDGPLPAAKNTPLAPGQTTYYFRTSFEFAGNAQSVQLKIDSVVDDGAVFYLNGQELHRQNMPEGLVAFDTLATSSVGDADFTGPIIVPADALAVGTNVLAVEVHQASISEGYSHAVLASEPVAYYRLGETVTAPGGAADSASAAGPPQQGAQNGTYTDFDAGDLNRPGPRSADMLGGLPLLGFEADNGAPDFQGNLGGGNDVVLIPDDGNLDFTTGGAFSVEAWVKAPTGQEAGGPVVAKGTGAGGETFAMDIYGGAYRLYVFDSAGAVASVVQTTVAADDTWQHVVGTVDVAAGEMKFYINGQEAIPTAPVTPLTTLQANSHEVSIGSRQRNSGPYDLNFNGLIDEVALYDRALSGAEVEAHFGAAFVVGGPGGVDTEDVAFGVRLTADETLGEATFSQSTVLAVESPWKYDDSGTDLGTAWRETGFVDDAWSTGDALLFIDEDDLPAPKNTPLATGSTTHYFRTTFEVAGDLEQITELHLRTIIDDGAVFYLNGQEVYRQNMPDGPVTHDTLAAAEVDNAELSDSILIPVAGLAAGTNVLAVEVHQATAPAGPGPEPGDGTLPAVADGDLVLHLKADAVNVTVDGSNYVGQWNDTSGVAAPNHFVQGTAGSKPLWIDDALGGRPALRFDGNSDWMSVVGTGLAGVQLPFSFFAVTAGTANPLALFDSAPMAVDTFRMYPAGSVEMWPDSPAIPLSLNPTGSVISIRGSQNGTGNRVMEMRELSATGDDSSSGTGNTAQVAFNAATTPNIGTINQGNHGFFNGDLAELIVYSGPLSTADQTAVERYLLEEYAIVVPPPEEDLAFGAELVVEEIVVLPEAAQLRFNEVESTVESDFWLEIANTGSQTIDLDGFVLARDNDEGRAEYVFGEQTIESGQLLALAETTLGFDAADGDRLFLYPPSGSTVLDAVVADASLRGRSPDGDGPWRFADVPTPAAPNSFQFHGDVVINEIFYHARPLPGTPGTPASYSTETLLNVDHTWRYNQTGDDLGSAWFDSTHAVDGVDWFSGDGLLGQETNPGALPDVIRTPLTVSAAQTTYYFETEFTFDGDLATVELQLRPVVDDGAIFYLNGEELYSLNMSTRPVTAATFASPGVGDATFTGPEPVPNNALVVGTNVLSVEVHQSSAGSTDVVFGVELLAATETTPATPGTPFADDPEEWIELYNRSTLPVDLSGWKLKDAVQFEFPLGTMLEPDEYLVVAKDAAALEAKYPALSNIAGNFSGSLSNGDERILLDDAAGNPADEVHYFDGGRWDARADGDGASLELRDARADNSRGEAWAASDEAAGSEWVTYTYRGTAGNNIPGAPTLWHEFALGMLDGAGEVLLDDVSVVEWPGGAATELIQNGSFDDGLGAGTADHWRLLGNHQRSTVVVDPADLGNYVLHLVASGATEYQGNQIETTLAGDVAIVDGREYEISFRAKWLAGSQQINSRLYFSRLAQTTFLQVPGGSGTPGMPNSRAEANIGPTFDGLQHDPVLPEPNEPITVSVLADDPDGVAAMGLHWRVDGQSWTSAPMAAGAGGAYAATIPGHPAGSVVQYYVEGSDSAGAVATFPAPGPDSRALLKVEDGQTLDGTLHEFRVIMLAADADHMHLGTNSLSNERLGATVVYEGEVFHDVGIRLKGSFVGRDADRVGFNIAFNSDQLFRGVHDKVAVDRSTHANLGVDEILVKHIANQAGGIPSMYDDLIHFVGARSQHTGTASLRIAGFDEVYLDSQFAGGSDGTVYEYEVIRWATTTVDGDPESLKRAGGLGAPNGYAAVAIQDLGDDKEDYRWNSLIVSNRTRDDYDSIIAMGKAMSLSGSALDEASRAAMDVDEWMRTLAFQSLVGPADAGIHNFRLYARPEDNRVLYMPWDWDSAFMRSTTAAVVEGYYASKVVNLPANLRAYYGHIKDIIDTSFNTAYMSQWTDHYGQLAGQNFAGRLNYVNARSNFVLGQLPAAFALMLNDAGPIDVGAQDAAVVAGRAWIDVFDIRLAGTDEPLDVTWVTDQQTAWADGWQVTIPVEYGTNDYTFQAYDFHGNQIDSLTLSITSSLSGRPVEEFLRIGEIMYNPAEPAATGPETAWTDNDDFEFIELVNTSAAQTLVLDGVAFTSGVTFTFPDDNPAVDETSLPPGNRIVLVRDLAAFEARYDTSQMNVVGPYRNPSNGSNKLANNGETIRLETAVGALVQEFTYNDSAAWPQRADGDGASLEAITTGGDYNDPASWHDSATAGGSPGRTADAVVLGRHLFYGDSAFGDAIATDKTPLSPGDTATYRNVSNYSGGINGLFVDVAHAAAGIAGGFEFLVGNGNDPTTWSPPSAAPSIVVHQGAGIGGSDRIEIRWADNTIRNTWLEISVIGAPATTGLPADDVFYFGHAIGEVTALGAGLPTPQSPPTAGLPGLALVNAADVIAIRDNPRGAANPASIDDPFDVNRDRAVDALDLILARNNATGPLSALRLIETALPAPAPPGEGEPALGTGPSAKAHTASLDALMAAKADRPAVDSLSPSPILGKLLHRNYLLQ